MGNGDGLEITEEQFMRMNQKGQNLIIFKNLSHLAKQMKGFSVRQRIIMLVGSFLFTTVMWLITLHVL